MPRVGPDRTLLVPAYVAVALAYLVTRLLLIWRFPIHLDESRFATWTLHGHDQGGSALFESLASGQQPLLPWLGAAAMGAGVEPVTALRLVSFAAGAATLVIIAIFATHVFGAWAGLTAAALYVLVPFTLLYTALGLYDPLATLFVCAAMVLQYEHARRPGLDLALLLGLVLAFGVLTKLTVYSALYLAPLSALAFDWAPHGRVRRLALWIGGLALAFAVAFIGSRIVLLSDLADDLPAARELLAQNTFGEALDDPQRWIEQNWPPYRDVLGTYLTFPVVLASAVGAGLLLRRRLRLGAFLVLWTVIPLAGLVLLSAVPYGRWLLIVVPQLILLAAFGIVEAAAFLARLPLLRHAAAVATCVLAFVPIAWFDAGLLADPTGERLPRIDDEAYLTGHAAGTPWDAVARWLRARPAPGMVVVAAAPSCCGALPLELRDERTMVIASAETSDVPEALYGLENGLPLPPRADGLTWRRLRTFPRPRDGVSVVLYESGVLHDLEFAASPDELRTVVGGGDRTFDSYVAARPAVRAWLHAWYRAYQPS